MLDANADALANQLDNLRLEIQRKLENAVQGFTKEAAVVLIGTTPLGNSTKYAALYHQRQLAYGFKPIEGLAQGSWQVVLSRNNMNNVQVYDGQQAFNNINNKLSTYKLGQDVYIGNVAPYFSALEAGSSKQALSGIVKPTIPRLQMLFAINMQQYYI